MYSIVPLLFVVVVIVVWSTGAQGAAYMKFDGIDGSVANNDQVPRPGDPYTDVE